MPSSSWRSGPAGLPVKHQPNQYTGVEPPVRVELTTYALRVHFVEVGSVMYRRIERAVGRKASQLVASRRNSWGNSWGTFPARAALLDIPA